MNNSLRTIARIADEVDVSAEKRFRHRDLGLVDLSGREASPNRLLADFLYLHYFAGDDAEVRTLVSGAETHAPLWADEDGGFIAAVEQANTTRGCVSADWCFEGAAPGGDGASVRADGHVMTVGWELLIPQGDLVPGASVDVLIPPFRRYAQRGWYVLFGEAGARLSGHGPVVRTYFAPRDPKGVLRLVAALTTSLNDRGAGFQIKLRNNPRSYRRLDAFVLYLRAGDWLDHRDAIVSAHREAHRWLRDSTPCFVRELARGVGIAQEPDHDGTDLSFGQHRCLVVAEGLLTAFDGGADTSSARYAAILDQFRLREIDAERPYLSASSSSLDHRIFAPWDPP